MTESKKYRRIISAISIYPPFYLKSPHIQTVLAGFAPQGDFPHSKTERISLGKGDALTCEITTPRGWDEKFPTLVALHGLGGSYLSSYLVRLALKVSSQLNLRVIRVNLRNCGTGAGLSKLPYCAGNSHDLLCVIKTIKEKVPSSPIYVAGFSLGGNIVLKFLGELGQEPLVEQALAVCVPLDLSETVTLLQKGFNRVYDQYYLWRLKKQTPSILPWHKIHTLYDFDNYYIGPEWGYKDAEDYYAHCSSKAFLELIKTPTQILFTKDDPIVDYQQILDIENRMIQVDVASHGGHMGLFAKTKSNGYFWLDEYVLNWLKFDHHFS